VIELTEPKKLSKKTDAAIEALKRQRLRWVTGISQVGVKIDERKYHETVDRIMKDEIERQMIIGAIRDGGPLTIRELSQATDIPPNQILRHVIALRKVGEISEAGEKGDEYLYTIP